MNKFTKRGQATHLHLDACNFGYEKTVKKREIIDWWKAIKHVKEFSVKVLTKDIWLYYATKSYFKKCICLV